MNRAQTEVIAEIAEDLPVAIWVADAHDGKLVYANLAFATTMGMPARSDVAVGGYAEPYGIYTREGRVYPEERMPFVRALRERTTVTVDDLSIHRGDGTRVAVRAVAKPLLDAHHEIKFITIVFFDVTAEVEAQRERFEAEERLRQVVDHAPVMLWAMDKDGIVTLSEGRGLENLGLTPGQLVGKTVLELYWDEPETLRTLKRALMGEEFRATLRASGRTFESYYVPRHGPSGELLGVSVVTTDLTEHERLQARLVQADRMAALGTIAASVAHEINTPLAYVSTSLDFLARELPSLPTDPRQETFRMLLEDARRGIERVKTIARDLNSFSRPQERKHPVDVLTVLESALRMGSNEITSKARVIHDFQPVSAVEANEARLGQVFLNLLLNAAQSFPDADVSRNEIYVRVRQAQERISVEISDNGAGVDVSIMHRIFEPFFTTKPMGIGSRLGLSICQDIVRTLGGDITVNNRAGGGATARVELFPTTSRPTAAVTGIGTQPDARRRVLVIDDSVALARVLTATLSGWCNLKVVSSGQAALECLLGPDSYDVVICDLMMPGMSGMEVYAAVKSQRPGAEKKICFMSGGAYSQEARDFLAEIPNRCFEKPFDFTEVISEILRGA